MDQCDRQRRSFDNLESINLRQERRAEMRSELTSSGFEPKSAPQPESLCEHLMRSTTKKWSLNGPKTSPLQVLSF